ncbi:MAG: N-acetylmuramoyl-L-alanine amidase [Chthoniobacter sp.]|jgi:N-acetylmuramoyl-L-alanine amidase|nr:N-acetylmuramoyl-L-alanine amidase [Chthoniobacter sp.]
MRRALLIITALLGSVALAAAAEWQLIKIAGRDYVTLDNVSQFYGFNGVQRSGGNFALQTRGRSLRGQAESVEFLINGLKFNLSYPITEHDGHLCLSRMDLTKLIEPVLRPSKIKNSESVTTIVLDAGHGGHDRGATSPFGTEQQFTLDVVARARQLLMAAGLRVVLTRSADVFVPLDERVRIANQYRNALFVSVHFNSGGSGTGLETYTLAPRGVPSMMADGPRVSDLDPCPGHACDSQNMALATAMHAALVVKSQMYDRGIKRARFVVIRDISIPGVLIEGGFQSNTYDARLIASTTYRQTMAACILQAVQNYRRAVGPQLPDESSSPSPGVPPVVPPAPVPPVAAAAPVPPVVPPEPVPAPRVVTTTPRN